MPACKLELEYRGDTCGLITTFRGSTGTVRLYLDREESGRQVASAGGGGYDKRGTCLAEFITETFQPELRRIASRAHAKYRRDASGQLHQTYRDNTNPRSLYGMTAYYQGRSVERVRLDGACGYGAIVRIADAIGLTIEFAGETRDAYVHTMRGLAKIRDRRARDAAKADAAA